MCNLQSPKDRLLEDSMHFALPYSVAARSSDRLRLNGRQLRNRTVLAAGTGWIWGLGQPIFCRRLS